MALDVRVVVRLSPHVLCLLVDASPALVLHEDLLSLPPRTRRSNT
jgi:hypothetical protein